MAVQHKLSPRDMLLICVTVCCLLIGSSAGLKYHQVCYGSSLTLPLLYTPPAFTGKMYFTPSDGGPRRLIMDNGEAKDSRLILASQLAELRDLTDRDDGTFSITRRRVLDIIRLQITDCSEEVMKYYGASYSSDIPRYAESLEFTRLHSKDQPTVLWNRTRPQTFEGGRVQVTRNGRSWEIKDLTQADNGHYSFRAKNNSLMKRIRLKVKGHDSYNNGVVNGQIFIEKLFGGPLWSVTFKRMGDEDGFPIPLIERGELVKYRYAFARRLWLDDGGIQIENVESGDSGTFEFRDQQGNLAQTVELDVIIEEVPTDVIVGVTVGISIAMIACCCCVRKCCCKKRSSKRDEATPPVFYHDSTQPDVSSSSAAPAPYHSYRPMNSIFHKEPSATSLEQSVNNPVNIRVNPPQLEVAPLRGQSTDPAPTLGSDYLSSDPEPQFELKGLSFHTALPLSSESSFTDVYTSDKLNFL